MLIKLTEFAAKRSCTYMFNEAGKRTAKETFRHGKFAFMNGMTKRTSKALVPAWIDDYNTVHPHSALAMLSPVEFRSALNPSQAVR